MSQDDFYDNGHSGPSAPGLSWNDKHNRGCYVNQWRGGLVINTAVRPAHEYETRKPMFWKDQHGNDDMSRPQKKNLIITMYVPEEMDRANPADDGIRSTWITQAATARPDEKGNWIEITDTPFGAHCKAMEAAGVPKTLPEPGGYYYMCQTGTAPGKGQVDRKTWAVSYTRPTAESVALLERITRPVSAPQSDDMFTTPPPPPNGQQQPQQPAYQAPAPPAPPQQPTYQPPQQPAYQAPAPPPPPVQQPYPQQPPAPPQPPTHHQAPPPPPQPQPAYVGPYQQ